MSQRRQRLYRRLDRAERAAIERGLDKNRPARAMARDLGRSQSSVADEVRRNRTVTRGPGRGSRVESVPEGACARLRGWPHVCNGCNRRRYHCSMPFRCEYSAARAQLLADGELSAARRGVDRTEEEFESIAAKIRADLARGLSPAQIADARSSEFRAAPSTIYRWIERGLLTSIYFPPIAPICPGRLRQRISAGCTNVLLPESASPPSSSPLRAGP